MAYVGAMAYGIVYGNTTSTVQNCCIQTTNQYFYKSDINSSVSCVYLASNTNTSSFQSLVSNIESYPKFVALEQNRTGYTEGGEACSGNTNGTQFDVNFNYVDTSHPFRVCVNGTLDPQYYIDVDLNLTPSGYDLSQSAFTTTYYDSANSTYSCTTQLTIAPTG